jgi:hypothetical protein
MVGWCMMGGEGKFYLLPPASSAVRTEAPGGGDGEDGIRCLSALLISLPDVHYCKR